MFGLNPIYSGEPKPLNLICKSVTTRDKNHSFQMMSGISPEMSGNSAKCSQICTRF